MSRRADVVALAVQRGLAPCIVASPRTKADFLDAVAAALSFPSWTGRNWDALADALGDLSWLDRPAALIWSGRTALDPAAYDTAREILADADKLTVYLV